MQAIDNNSKLFNTNNHKYQQQQQQQIPTMQTRKSKSFNNNFKLRHLLPTVDWNQLNLYLDALP